MQLPVCRNLVDALKRPAKGVDFLPNHGKVIAVLDTPEATPCRGWASSAIGGPRALPGSSVR